MNVEEAVALARQHSQSGRFGDAHSVLNAVLAHNPNHADALHLLGMLAIESKDFDVAEKLIVGAISANPSIPEAHYHLGNLLSAKGNLDGAVACYHRAIELDPRLIEPAINLGNVLSRQGKFAEAVAVYTRLLAVRPDCSEAYSNLGNVLKTLGRTDEAMSAHRKAVELRPDSAPAVYNLANGLRDQLLIDEAIAAYRRAAHLRPDLAEPFNNLGNLLKDQGQLDEALACYDQAMRLAPDIPARRSNRLYAMLFHPVFNAKTLYDAHREWNRRHAEPLKQFIGPHDNRRDPERRLRIGYVSPDFYDHVVGRNVLPLLREHDRNQFEIFCYADVRRPDEFTQRFASYATGWRNILALNNEQTAQQIRSDKIDVLVDLTLHMAFNRLPVFARKPAPVQVTFAGYPGGTGLDAIDYRLTDPHLDPPGADRLYAEQSIRLPDTFWCYDPLAMTMGLEFDPAIGPPPAITNGFVTFGCLNNFCKINPQIIAIWSRVLKAVDKSKLILMAWNGSHRQRVLDRFASHGIDPGRIEFTVNRPRAEYLQYYRRIDIGLDSLPYNGHTSSLDSAWMGVPVITRVGATVVGRAGLSQLTNLGLREFAAASEDQFVEIARQLAGDIPRLSELRTGLRERMLQSPLMEAPRFARNIESAYREMWRAWCGNTRITPEGLKPLAGA